MRRIFVVGGAALVVAASAGFFLWGQTGGIAASSPYRVEAIDRGTITASVRATGTLNAVTTVLVGSQVSGLVVEILADFNSPVKAGQVVARLYADQILTRQEAARAELAQAEADLAVRKAAAERARATRERARAGLQDQEAQVERAQAQLGEAQRAMERQAALAKRDVGSQAALDTASTQAAVQRAALASANAQLAAAKAELAGLDVDITLAQAQVQATQAVILQREARLKEIAIDLERTQIRSPVDGVVIQREIDLGQTVAASLQAPTLFTIAQDLSRIDIHANIDETDVGRVRQGQDVTFTVSAYPARTFSGEVRMVRLGAQNVQNVVTYTAVIGVENADLALLPGMTANIDIVTDERADVLRVPNAALRFRPPAGAGTPEAGERADGRGRRGDGERRGVREAGEGATRGAHRGRGEDGQRGVRGRVFVLGPQGEPQAAPVRLGATDGSHTEILAGLDEGVGVVVGGGPRPQASAAPAPARRGPRLF